ncbi:MAG: hypothetical protein V3U84_07310 [Thiotrichaceae bacterium]
MQITYTENLPLLVIICLVFVPFPAKGEPGVFVGTSAFDRSNAIISDGVDGFHLIGSSEVKNGVQAWIAHYKPDSNEIVRTPIDLPITYTSSLLLGVTQLPGGDYIFVGSAQPAYQARFQLGEQKDDGWVVRMTTSGDILWSTTYPSQYHERFYFVNLLQNGSLLVGGRSENRGKLRSSNGVSYIVDAETGKSVKQKTWGKDIFRAGFQDGIALPDGGYVLIGWVTDPLTKNDDIWLVRVKPNHITAWERKIGEEGDDLGFHGLLSNDGHIVVFGWGTKTGASYKCGLILKLTLNGEEYKRAYFDFEKVGHDKFLFGITTHNDGYIAVGEASTSKKDFRGRAWAVSIDQNFNKIGEKVFNVQGSRFSGLTETPSKRYYATGFGVRSGSKNVDAWITEIRYQTSRFKPNQRYLSQPFPE